MSNIREPIKKSSIEKKNRIIERGFELMCNKGYHNVNCVDIAAYSNVSTGLIYQYFTDKRDIFIEGVKNYSNKILFPMLDILENQKFDKNKLNIIINDLIDSFIKTHTISKSAHEELMAMSHSDKEIADIFSKREIEFTKKIVEVLLNNGINTINLKEKVHIIIGLVDNLCHDTVYHNHSDIDYKVMKDETIDIILYLLNVKTVE